MGRASHNLAGSYLSVHTAMPPGELLDLSEMVANEVFKRRADKPGPIVKTGRTASSIDFAVVNPFKNPLMRFRVHAVNGADGGTDLKSQITNFATRQQKFAGFIPAGPKRLLGWNSYSTFMASLQAAVSDADKAARTSITTAPAG
jgi:hypothetical protein